jgi:hypothetical protein
VSLGLNDVLVAQLKMLIRRSIRGRMHRKEFFDRLQREIGPVWEEVECELHRAGEYVRTPDGSINNCSLANSADEKTCQICKGTCPDRERFKRG